jgi:hypothetical protein
MEPESTEENKKKRLSIHACNLCKMRHLRCSGIHPCEQCAKHKVECVFGAALKRGKRKQIPEYGSLVNTFKASDSVFRFQQIPFHHFSFIDAFAESIQPFFPGFVPRTYQIVLDPSKSVQSIDPRTFTILEQLCGSKNITSWAAGEICDAFEYAIVCSHGMAKF